MNRTVSVNNKGNIREILDDIFTGSNIEYSIVDNQIILSNKKQTASVAQTSTVKGTVKDNKGEALIGVNVKVKGTTSGTITDFDGNFTLQANKGDILEFSYVGYQTITMKVGNQASYQITMSEDTETLQEVVVTALGIKRETKALTYNVQEMKSEALTTVKDANLINSLAGKIAGVTINQSASGIGGSSRVVMRGLKSITNDNNALYVIDGIPMASMRSNQDKSFYENADGGDSEVHFSASTLTI